MRSKRARLRRKKDNAMRKNGLVALAMMGGYGLFSSIAGFLPFADAGVTVTVNDKTVTVTDGSSVYSNIYGNGGITVDTTEPISGYTLDFTGGHIDGAVYGAYSDGSADVSDNTVNFSGGYLAGLYPENHCIYGGYSVDGNVTGNTVNLSTND
nr:hypothetical protein [Anaerovibrio sp.]